MKSTIHTMPQIKILRLQITEIQPFYKNSCLKDSESPNLQFDILFIYSQEEERKPT